MTQGILKFTRWMASAAGNVLRPCARDRSAVVVRPPRPSGRNLRMKGSAAASMLLTLHLSTLQIAHANVGTELNSFFNDLGGAGNANGPAAYQGQAAGYYTGGNIWTRFPQKSVNPINLQLPNARAGCGGIDLFAGSFSFINSSELVALLKATASNALGFAFQLAIKSISPQISSAIEELSQKAQQINQFNMNSCEMAQGLVGTLWPKNDATQSEICKAIANSQGWATDWAKSRQECNNGGKRDELIAKNKDSSIPSGPYNFTWDMLKKSYGSIDTEFREYLMTLVGTVIFIPPADGAGAGPVINTEGAADLAVMTALLDGTATSPVKVMKCDETEKCLHPKYVNLSISAAQALKPRVKEMIMQMAQKVKTDTALSANEIGLLGATSLPLYKIITVRSVSMFGALTDGDADVLAEMVAVDMLETFITQLYSMVTSASGKWENADEGSLKLWRDQIGSVNENLSQRSRAIGVRLESMQIVLERTKEIERQLRNGLSPQMLASVQYSGQLSPNKIN